MQWDLFTGQQIILVALILGFLLLAGLCLSARAFTQLLDVLAKTGFLERRTSRVDPPVQTTSSTVTEVVTGSVPQDDDPTISVIVDTQSTDRRQKTTR